MVRNLSINIRKSDARRKMREESSVPDRAVPSPAEIAAREEARQKVVAAVQELESPYRDVIVLHFYEALPPREVASRLGLPVETVRTRIRRGLARLRSQLDAAYGSDGKAWTVALAPLAGFDAATTAGLAAGTAAAQTTLQSASLAGTSASIGSKMVVGVMAVLVVLSGVVCFTLLTDREDGIPAGKVAALDNSSPIEAADRGGPERMKQPGIADEDDFPSRPERVPVKPGAVCYVSGRVTDSKTGEPIRAFDFHLIPGDYRKALEKWEFVHTTVRDENGCYRVPVGWKGPYIVDINSSTHCDERILIEEHKLDGNDAKLDRGFTVRGRVVCDTTGVPVAGAVVGTEGLGGLAIIKYRAGFTEICSNTTTDEDGRFVLRGVDEYDDKIVALHRDYAIIPVDTPPDGNKSVLLRLKKGFCAHGQALSDKGDPIADLPIYIINEKAGYWTRAAVTDRNGFYRTPPVLPGSVTVRAEMPFWKTPEVSGFTTEEKKVELKDQDIKVDFGCLERYVTWRGTLYDCDGSPLPDWDILAVPGEIDLNNLKVRPKISRFEMKKASSDADGRFELYKLKPMQYSVIIAHSDTLNEAPGMQSITFAEPGIVERDLQAEGASIRGVVIDERSGEPLVLPEVSVKSKPAGPGYRVEAMQGWTGDPEHTGRVTQGGRFTMIGLEPGDYRLVVDGDGMPLQTGMPISLEKGQSLTDLAVPLKRWGKMQIIFDGFDNLPEKRFRLVLEKDDQRFPAEDYKISGDSSDGFMKAERDLYSGDLSSRMSIRLEAGTWKATLLFNRLGSLQREFVVKDGALTTIEFRPEFTDSGKGVALSGTLRRVDGSPVANVEVEFLCKDVPGIEEDYIEWVRSIFEQGLVTDDMFDAELVEALRSGKLTGINEDQVSANSKEFQLMVAISNAINSLDIPGNPLKMETHHTTVTDAAGRFFVRSIRPGRWSVIVRRNRAWIDLPDLVLPDKIQGAHEITLTMPDNTVTGRIGNSAAVLDMVHSLHFSIIDSDGEQVFMDSPGKEGSDPFRLEGIPDGTHRLLIHATDFMDFESAPFELSGGQSLDLGTIHMRPCGVIHLKAVDAGGTEIRYYGATSLSTGRELRHVGFNDDFQVYTNALLGQSIIRITADSYRDKDIVVDIEHGKPVELTVEMEAL